MKNYLISDSGDSYDLWDPFFRDFLNFPVEREVHRNTLMRADVREDDKQYHIDVDLPSIKKEDIRLELDDGYLTIHATRNESRDEKSRRGKLIRRERFCGSYSRTFYVGEDVTKKDIHAKLADGTLTLDINKVQPKAAEKHYIEIE